jgi:hypothetical protein
VAKWIDVKSNPFIFLDLKLTPQKNWLKKSKYTFDFTFGDHIFDTLLKNNFIRIIDHNALPLLIVLNAIIKDRALGYPQQRCLKCA